MKNTNRKNPRNKDINVRLRQSELDMIQYVSEALNVSRTDSIILSVKYLINVAKTRYKRKGGYSGMKYMTREELENAKEKEVQEWREEARQRELEELEEEISGSLAEFGSREEIEDYIEKKKETIEDWLDEQEPDIRDKIDDEFAMDTEAIEDAEEELKEYIHELIFN